MNLDITKSSEVISAIALLFQRELDPRSLYGSVYTSPNLGNYLNKQSVNGEDQFLAVTNSNELVGALQFRIFDHALHINNVAISSNYHGIGIGRELVTWVINKASDMGKYVTLDVNLENGIAQSWYKKLGFIQTSFKENFVFKCEGINSISETFVLGDVHRFEEYGFSDAHYEQELTSRFFCIKHHFIRLKHGGYITSDEIARLKSVFSGYLILDSENCLKLNGLQPSFIQAICRMELKCG